MQSFLESRRPWACLPQLPVSRGCTRLFSTSTLALSHWEESHLMPALWFLSKPPTRAQLISGLGEKG